MAYLIFAVVMAAALIAILSIKFRTSKDPAKTVDSFQRAIKAMTPDRKAKVKRP